MAVDPFIPRTPGVEANIAERLASLERTVRTLSTFLNGGASGQVPVVASFASLPAGRRGRVAFNSSDGKLYVDNGSSWVPQT